ncbi:MAG: outer membrane beta-barrel protein [Nitrospirota bacterium]
MLEFKASVFFLIFISALFLPPFSPASAKSDFGDPCCNIYTDCNGIASDISKHTRFAQSLLNNMLHPDRTNSSASENSASTREEKPTILSGNADLLSNTLCDGRKDSRELSTFNDREKAEKFKKDINKLGFKAHICRDIKEKDGTYYKVFVTDAGESPEKTTTRIFDKSGDESVLQEPSDEDLSGKSGISDEIFERKKRYIHPFLSVTTFYTDNILNTKRAKKSDLITVISPGVWLSIPHTQKQLSLIDTSIRSPGGFIVEGLRYEFLRRFMAYLFYQADIELFSRHSSENTVKHRIQGRIEYAMKGGLSIALTDEYLISHDDRGKGISTGLDKYHTNLFEAVIKYDPRRKLALKAGYSNYRVTYDSSKNRFMKRMDNTFSGSLFYKFTPKTSIFAEYEFIDINYDDDSLSDSREHNLWAGLQWDVTAKSRGMLKAGYGTKKFKRRDIRNNKTFVLEGRIEYRLTSKTSFNFLAWRKTNETDISTTNFIVSTGARIGYLHKLTGKISDFASLSYINDRYKGEFTSGGKTGERDDNYYSAGIGIRYEFRRWLNSEIGYIYGKRDSNFQDYDYSNNTLYFKINSSM